MQFYISLYITHITEILIMIGCGDRMRTQNKICDMFTIEYSDCLISQSTESRIESKFREAGHVRVLPSSGEPSVSVLLSIEKTNCCHESLLEFL